LPPAFSQSLLKKLSPFKPQELFNYGHQERAALDVAPDDILEGSEAVN
jgi:hypothetical protein